VDVGAELTGGCYGFASRFMHWPEELIVGGATTNSSSGHVVRARALQTVIQLMGARDMFEFWQNTYKVHHIEWNHSKAGAVIAAWQRRFTDTLNKLMRGQTVRTSPEDEFDFIPSTDLNNTQTARLANYKVVAFSTASLDELVAEFSELSVPKLIAGYLLMVRYFLVEAKSPKFCHINLEFDSNGLFSSGGVCCLRFGAAGGRCQITDRSRSGWSGARRSHSGCWFGTVRRTGPSIQRLHHPDCAFSRPGPWDE